MSTPTDKKAKVQTALRELRQSESDLGAPLAMLFEVMFEDIRKIKSDITHMKRDISALEDGMTEVKNYFFGHNS